MILTAKETYPREKINSQGKRKILMSTEILSRKQNYLSRIKQDKNHKIIVNENYNYLLKQIAERSI